MKNILFMNYEVNDKKVTGDLDKKHLNCVCSRSQERLNKGFSRSWHMFGSKSLLRESTTKQIILPSIDHIEIDQKNKPDTFVPHC